MPRQPEPEPVPSKPEIPYSTVPPQLPSAIKQVFLPPRISLQEALTNLARSQSWSLRSEKEQQGFLVYEPALAGLARLRFPHTKSRQTHSEEVAYLLPTGDDSDALDWSEARVKLEASDLDRTAASEAYFAELPRDLGGARSLSSKEKEFEDHLYYNSSMVLLYNPHLELYSKFGETGEEFQRRCRDAAKAALDGEAEKLRDKYEKQLERLEERLKREERELEEDKIEHDARKQEELLSGVESVFGLFGGRRSSSRLSSASRRRRMTRQARADVEESEEVIEDLQEQIEELEQEAKDEIQELSEKWASLIDEVEEVEVHPRRADVEVSLFALAWVPHWEVVVAGQFLSMPAFELERV